MRMESYRLGGVGRAAAFCLVLVLATTAAVAVPPLQVVNFNNGSKPVLPASGVPSGFKGYFSPRAGESFEAKVNGAWTTITVAADGGCRFGESRGAGKPTHTGIDLAGWVEKVSTDGRPPGYEIHLFDTTWKVHNVRAGLIENKTSDGVYIEHYSPDDTKEEYLHLSNLLSKNKPEDVAINEVLGSIQDLAWPQLDHLHYALKDADWKYIDPESTAAGDRGLTQTVLVVPEPATLSLLAVGGLALLWRRR